MHKDCRAILAYNNRFHARQTKRVEFVDQGETFIAATPLENLSRMQLNEFSRFEGATAELDCIAVDSEDNPQAFAADVLALAGHTLPAGALVEFINDADLIAAATWRPAWGTSPHLVVALPEPVELDTLTVRISNAGAGARIGAVWASPSIRFLLDARWSMTGFDTGSVSRPESGGAFTNPGRRGWTLPIRFRARRMDISHGLHLPGASLAIPATWDTDNSDTATGNQYTFDDEDGTLLEQAAVFEAGKHYEIELQVTYAAGNAGIPAVELGTGNQWALQPGRNQIVGTPDDGSDLALKFLTATATGYSGSIEILTIKECTPPQATNAKHVIETAAATEPVLWLPRTGQAWHQIAATYALLAEGANITHRGGPVHDVRMDVTEVV